VWSVKELGPGCGTPSNTPLVKRLSAYPKKVWGGEAASIPGGGGVLSPYMSVAFGEVAGAGEKR
jgi:hypothetical protein